MKKIALIIGFVLILIGISLQRDGFLQLELQDATLIVFYHNNTQELLYSADSITKYNDAYSIRIDCSGDKETLEYVRNKLQLQPIKQEIIGDISVFYEYSYLLDRIQYNNNKGYNIMIAITNDKLIIGYPIIAGSY